MSDSLTFELSYEGRDADENKIDFYDVGQALIGFQRSLALTTHLVLNGEVITQAPSLKGAKIFAQIPREGSWEILAGIALVGSGLYKVGTAPKDTPIGHLVSSAYDYVISEVLGFHVDYEKTLGQQIDEQRAVSGASELQQSKFDSLAEKCQVAIRDMHRPIVWSETAKRARITSSTRGDPHRVIGHPLNAETYEYIAFTETSKSPFDLTGRVSGYNSNTYKGRIYVLDEFRPIPFEITTDARSFQNVGVITQSLRLNAQDRKRGNFNFRAYKDTSKSGRLKRLLITDVFEPDRW